MIIVLMAAYNEEAALRSVLERIPDQAEGTVGDNSVLGYSAVLMAGVNVGYRCIVGANSVVAKEIPDYTVAGGVPAKPIKQYLPPDSGHVWQPSDGRPDGV
jgi:acetyltransferase-like isoleucine patch superfamily enzyme